MADWAFGLIIMAILFWATGYPFTKKHKSGENFVTDDTK